MKIIAPAINIILCSAALLVLTAACSTPSGEQDPDDENYTALTMHLESNDLGMGKTEEVRIYKRNSLTLRLNKEPFLDHRAVDQAEILDRPGGGFSITLRLNQRGSFMMESMTTASRGQRIGIYAQWPEGRWLAAVKITRTINNGIFIFTPDATREEAERIVDGLNQAAKKRKD